MNHPLFTTRFASIAQGGGRPWLQRLGLALLLMVLAGPISAATHTVTSNADSGAGTLRQALVDAIDGDTIAFNLSSGSEIISLASQLSPTKTLTIDGANTAGSGVPVTLQVTDPGVSAWRLFYIATAGKTFSLSNMTLKGGDVGYTNGGVILANNVMLSLNRVTVTGSKAWNGGGVYVDGSSGGAAHIENSLIHGNTAYQGGGLYSIASGEVRVVNSTITGNHATSWGGGVYQYTGSLLLMNTTIAGNTAATSGGGIQSESSGFSYAVNSIFINNTATSLADIAAYNTFRTYYSWYDPAKVRGVAEQSAIAPNVKTPYTTGDLSALANNGGPTQTLAVPAGKPPAQQGTLVYYNATNRYYFRGANELYYRVDTFAQISPSNPDADKIATDQRGEPRATPPTIGAYDTPYLTPVNGACGSANGGGPFTSAPTESLCTTGTASAVDASVSAYTWTCAGQNGGANSGQCSASRGYTVTPSAGPNGSLSPSVAQTVVYNGTQNFTVTPASGYLIDSVSGCNGSLSDSIYTTGAITAACEVTATFKTAPTYTLGGSVEGLGNGNSVVLQNNGTDNKTIGANGAFTFATAVNAGSTYAVTVLTQPTGQACTVANGSGTASGNVSNIAVSCGAAYVLTYNANGKDGTVPAGGSFGPGTQVTVAAGSSVLWNKHPAQYWNTAANGTGTRYETGSMLTMPASDVTLYAQWNTASVNARISQVFYDVFYWKIGLGASDDLAPQTAPGTPTKHCIIAGLFLCTFDPLDLSLPISRNSAVTSRMFASNMACRYTDVRAPQVPVTIPWTYIPFPGLFNLFLPGTTTVGWTVADSADNSFTNAVSCDIGGWIALTCTDGSGKNICASLNTYRNEAAGTAGANVQGSGPAAGKVAPAVGEGNEVTYVANSQNRLAAGTTGESLQEAGPKAAGRALTAVDAEDQVTYVATCTSDDGGVPVSGTSTTNTMTITGPTPGKRYRCSFTARYGSYESDPPVPNDNGDIVIAVPTDTTNVFATPGPSSITLSFGTSSGSGAITYGALCTSSDGGALGYAVHNGSPLTVTGLTPGKTYTCEVSAQDSNGMSRSVLNVNGPVVVQAPVNPPTPIPTLANAALVALALLLVVSAFGSQRRRF